jgi:hypothetical protein
LTSRIVTLALGTTLPEGSLTVPEMVPETAAHEEVARNRRKQARVAANRKVGFDVLNWNSLLGFVAVGGVI